MQVDTVTMARYRLMMEEAAEAKREADEQAATALNSQKQRTAAYESARERYIAYLEGQATIVTPGEV